MFSLGRSWGDGWREGAGFHRPVQGSRYSFPPVPALLLCLTIINPAPGTQTARGRMRATPSPRHLQGKGDREAESWGGGERAEAVLCQLLITQAPGGIPRMALESLPPASSIGTSGEDPQG